MSQGRDLQHKQQVLNSNSIGESKGEQPKKRAKQISGLHAEFEELKKKIRDVQNKNQRIIEKIHNAFNFKKKGVYAPDESETEQEYPNDIHNESENTYDIPLIMNYATVPGPRNEVGFESKARRNYNSIANEFQLRNNNATSQVENIPRSNLSIKSKSPRAPVNLQNPYHQTYSAAEYINQGKNTHLESLLHVQKNKVEELLRKLQRKEQESVRLQNIEQRFRSYAQNSKLIIESQLSNFLENYVRNAMIGVEKSCKRNDLRLFNLNVLVRQAHQERQSARVIRQHRYRRSESRSARKIDRKNSKTDLNKSQTRISPAEMARKNKEFQEIAAKYQQIIKNKNEEIDSLDKKLKSKQLQVTDLKNRVQALSRQLKEEANKIHDLQSSASLKSMKQTYIDQELNRKMNQQQMIIAEEKNRSNILSLKFSELEKCLQEKDAQINNVKQNCIGLENRILSLQAIEKKSDSTIRNLERLEKQLKQKCESYSQLQTRCNQAEKKCMQKQCELYGVVNKLKKLEQISEMKEKKIEELQSLIHSHEDVMERSVLESSIIMNKGDNRSEDVRKLMEENERFEEQLQRKSNEIFSLIKQKDYAQNRANELEEKVQALKKQIEVMEDEVELKSLRSNSNAGDNFDEYEEQRKKLEDDLNELSEKCSSYSKTIQSLRTENLEISSKLMKTESQLQFVRENLQEKDNNYEKLKTENEGLRVKHIELEKTVNHHACELELERKSYQQRIEDLQNKWNQFQENLQNGNNDIVFDGRSERSSIFNIKSNYNLLSTQNQFLSQKLKEAQALIETQNIMEQRIIQQYRLNVEKVKTELREKCNLIDKLNSELEKSRKRLSHLEARERQQSENYEQNAAERIEQLQHELKETKEINVKLTEMSNELFEQIKAKQEEKNDIVQEIQYKKNRIHELEQIMESKEIPILSRASVKSKIKDTHRSHLSNLEQSQSFLPQEGTIDFDLSIDHSFIDNSLLNVSELFRGDLPHDKLKLRKREHKLFQKTASYITSLKEVIEEKNKRIRLLEKKIESLKKSELVRKDYDLSVKEIVEDDMQGAFKDYESVDFENRRGTHHKRYKILQNDTKLIVQENNMLNQQIQTLQEEIVRAEQQENSLVKIKDLYKDQIKKLIKKNEQNIKAYESQLQKERAKIEDSESVHNYEALRQLFIKIFGVMVSSETGKRKQEKKKQLQEYVKVVCSILKVPQNEKDSILERIRTD